MEKFFLQSKPWEKFQNNAHYGTFRIESQLIIKHHLPLGKCWFYCPKPQDLSGMFFRKVRTLANKENAVFLKIDPEAELRFPSRTKVAKSSFIQPPSTLVLDLRLSQKELLSKMKPKTRYNVRLAEKHNVKVIEKTNEKAVNIFCDLADKTSERQKIRYHSKMYYQKMIDTLRGEGMVELLVAEHQNKPVAANIILYYGGTAYYLHGASDNRYRQCMAPYLLQWKAIQRAKRKGMKKYDFWGIMPSEKRKAKNAKYKNWEGITKFKEGFGGNEINYPETVDVIFQPGWYWIYNLIK